MPGAGIRTPVCLLSMLEGAIPICPSGSMVQLVVRPCRRPGHVHANRRKRAARALKWHGKVSTFRRTWRCCPSLGKARWYGRNQCRRRLFIIRRRQKCRHGENSASACLLCGVWFLFTMHWHGCRACSGNQPRLVWVWFCLSVCRPPPSTTTPVLFCLVRYCCLSVCSVWKPSPPIRSIRLGNQPKPVAAAVYAAPRLVVVYAMPNASGIGWRHACARACARRIMGWLGQEGKVRTTPFRHAAPKMPARSWLSEGLGIFVQTLPGRRGVGWFSPFHPPGNVHHMVHHLNVLFVPEPNVPEWHCCCSQKCYYYMKKKERK